MYRRWGIPAREERYGTWNEWRREIAHVDLIAPRKRPLEGVLSTWSPGTKRGDRGRRGRATRRAERRRVRGVAAARAREVRAPELPVAELSSRRGAEGGRDAGVVRTHAGGAHRGVQRVVCGAAPIRLARHRARATARRGGGARRADVARAATRTAGLGDEQDQHDRLRDDPRDRPRLRGLRAGVPSRGAQPGADAPRRCAVVAPRPGTGGERDRRAARQGEAQ